MNARSALAAAIAEGLEPGERLTLVEWAERYRVLQQREAAEPGRWRTARTPYLREVMECLSPQHPARTVVLKKGAQIGGTEVGNNWVGYIMHAGLGNTMVVQPTVELGERWSKQRLASLLSQPPLDGLVTDHRATRGPGSNTITMKDFPGGVLIVAGANSAVGLRSMPARFLFMDELSAYPWSVSEEGDPIALARRRASTYRDRKEFLCSTPKTEGTCRISVAYEETDQRQYHVPCPHCGTFQPLVDEHLVWPKGRHDEAAYYCVACGDAIDARNKRWMLREGYWVAQHPEQDAVGFHLPGFYSPWLTWAEIAKDKHEAAQRGDAGMQVYVNTMKGEAWLISGERVDWRRLYERREGYATGVVPDPAVVFLTAGVDVQKDRLEVEVKGWARDRQSWSIDYRVLPGDTQEDDVWEQLDALLAEGFPCAWTQDEAEPQVRHIACMAVDSGYNTDRVYAFTRRHSPKRVIAVKGQPQYEGPLGIPARVDVSGRDKRRRSRLAGKVLVWPVGTDYIKSELHGYLKKERPTEEELAAGAEWPSGYCHYPAYGEAVFQQLCAEQLVETRSRKTGQPDWVWQLLPGRRNEALDTHVYARAAASRLGYDARPAPKARSAEAPKAPPERREPQREAQPPSVAAPPALQQSAQRTRKRAAARMRTPW